MMHLTQVCCGASDHSAENTVEDQGDQSGSSCNDPGD